MNKSYIKTFWYVFLLAHIIVIIAFWLNGSGSLLSSDSNSIIIALGRITGLLGAFAVLLQFFLMGRLPFLEKYIGLDKLSRIHRISGFSSIFFIIAHPILISWGYGSKMGRNPFEHIIWSAQKSDDLFLALISVILFIIVVASSLYIVRKKIKYEYWYFVHLTVYLAILFSFSHQFEIGTDLNSSQIFYGYFVALYILVLVNHLFFRFGKPVYKYFFHQFNVVEIKKENGEAYSINISGKNMDKFKIDAGQFMIFRFLTKGRWWQAHPFSLSKPFDGKNIRITVKKLGDFTSSIKDIPLGTKVIIEGPYGVFRDFFGFSNKALLIAGGIGITPIRSLYEKMLTSGKNVCLLYANKNTESIILKNEIDAISDTYKNNAKYIDVISDDQNYAGEKGYIDEEKIKRLVPDLNEREIYICGPVPMMNKLILLFRNLGIPKSKVHFEKFSLS